MGYVLEVSQRAEEMRRWMSVGLREGLSVSIAYSGMVHLTR